MFTSFNHKSVFLEILITEKTTFKLFKISRHLYLEEVRGISLISKENNCNMKYHIGIKKEIIKKLFHRYHKWVNYLSNAVSVL